MTTATEPTQQIIDEFVGVAHGDYARLKTLLEQYPSLATATATWGETAIQAAAQMARRDIADLLLAAGAPFDICTAAAFGMSDKVEEMLAANPDQINATGAHGISLMYFPVVGGHTDLAESLLARGAALGNGEGSVTPLHGAAMFGKAGMAAWLLEHGAEPNPRDYENKTPLRVALDHNHAEVAEVLRRHGGTE